MLNSWISGYFVAIVAGLWPAVAKSIVLINSAGNVVPQYSSVPLSKVRGLKMVVHMEYLSSFYVNCL